jgi:hypothetical protein
MFLAVENDSMDCFWSDAVEIDQMDCGGMIEWMQFARKPQRRTEMNGHAAILKGTTVGRRPRTRERKRH